MPLDILYVGTLPPHPGGSAISCSQILLALAGAGHAVRSVAPMTREAAAAGDAFARASPGLGVRRYPVPYFEIQPFTAPASYWRDEGRRIEPVFQDLVAERRPDVVVAGRESFAWHVPELAAASRLPCVVMARGAPWLPVLRARDDHPVLAGLRRATCVVTPADHLAAELGELGVEAVRVVPNPVDTARFRPRPRDRELARAVGIDGGDVVVVHASNLKPVKRPLDIVRSAERVLAEEPRVVYVVVGDGPCRAEMEAACSTAGVEGRFRFAGWADYDRMPDYLSLADIVVMPSELETQSRACLEAQASGRALLASDIPGAREIVVDGESGMLFGVGEVEDLAAKTLLLVRQPELRRRLGAQARRRVASHAPARVVRAYEAILHEAAERAPASP